MSKTPSIMIQGTAMAAAILALAACGPSTTGPEPKQADTAEPVSIVRADADIAVPEAPTEIEALAMTVPFAEGGSRLGDDALTVLAQILASPQMAAGGRIVLGGHTDSAGTDAANLRASAKRAEAVRAWFLANGVAQERITSIAFGEQNPAQPNASPDGTADDAARAANRRVEVSIAMPEPETDTNSSEAPGSLIEQVTAEN